MSNENPVKLPSDWVRYRAAKLKAAHEDGELAAKLDATLEMLDRVFGWNYELLRHDRTPVTILREDWARNNMCGSSTNVAGKEFHCDLGPAHDGALHSKTLESGSRLEWPKL